ncbi:MAG: 30S ribosomal protein S17 [bacterium]
MTETQARGQRKTKIGRVTSNKMAQTVVVTFERTFEHPVYRKFVRRRSKVYAHDEKHNCQIGDLVRVVETRPMSKLKHWRVVEVLERAK